MHQMRFSKTCVPVDKKGIIHFSGRFRHCKGSCMSKLVIISYNESIKGIFWIQICLFLGKGKLCILNSVFFRFRTSRFIRHDEFNGIFNSRHFRDSCSILTISRISSHLFVITSIFKRSVSILFSFPFIKTSVHHFPKPHRKRCVSPLSAVYGRLGVYVSFI